MNYMNQKFKFFAVLLLCMNFTSLFAQESTNASGGMAGGPGGSVSYSIGQTVYGALSEANSSVLQGVQQPFEIQVMTGIDAPEIQIGINAYPNPTSDYLLLKMENLANGNYYYQVSDALGQTLEQQQIQDHETRIEMQNLAPAIYYVQISRKNQTLKSFKIIKN